MNIKKIIAVTICSLLISSSVFAFDKSGTTSFQFLKIIATARAAALAGAYSTLGYSSEAVFWNPAGLTNVTGLSASVGYVDWFLDVNHYSVSTAYNVDGIGTFALFGMFADVGEIEVTRTDALGFVDGVYNPGLTGETINPGAFVAGLSYARALNDKFSFGLSVKYAQEDLIYKKAGALIFDGGMLYNTGFKSITIGASLRNFGPEIKYVDKSYPLPQTLNIGVSTYLISPSDPLITESSNQSLLISYDIIQPRDFSQQHSVGMEYSFDDMFFLRGGYIFNSDQLGLSAGAGVNISGYMVDYAYNDYGEYLGPVHRFTIGFKL